MSPKHHPMPLSGGDRKALVKELAKSRAMTGMLAVRSDQLRGEGEHPEDIVEEGMFLPVPRGRQPRTTRETK